MTWKEFKDIVESKGAKDNMMVDHIVIDGLGEKIVVEIFDKNALYIDN